MQTINVLMLGPSLDQKGGMATVQKLILEFVNKEVITKEIRIQHICTHVEGSIQYRIIIFAKALLYFVKQLLCFKVDLVHIHLSERGSVFRKAIFSIVSSIFNKPLIIHAHGAEFEAFFTNLPKVLKHVIRSIFKKCDAFIVLSKTQQNLYVTNLCLDRNRVFILPNAVCIPKEIPENTRKSEDRLTLVSIGRVGHRKGTFDLLNAFAQVPIHLRANTQMVIAGDGEIQAGKRIASNLGLSSRVHFGGWINPEKRNHILANADIFILPSYHEAFPMAILEAMAWGLPIITTPVGGISDLVTSNHNGILINPGNINELTAAIVLLLQEDQLRFKMGEAAKYTAESFDINLYSKRLAQLYEFIYYRK